MEILINTPNVRELIAANKIREIEKAMRDGGFYRMQTFNQALCKLVQDRVVAEQEALGVSTNPNDLKLMLKGVQTGAVNRGGNTEARPAMKINRSF
jgi:twitching motility protein PilT